MTDDPIQLRDNARSQSAGAVQTVNMSSANRRLYPFRRTSRTQRPLAQRRNSPGFIIFQRQRQKFMIRVYLLAIVFELLTVLQWVSVVSNPILVNFFKSRHYISLLAGLLVLILLTVFGLVLEIRYIEPYNWIFAYIIVELQTLALMRGPLDADLRQLEICLLVTIGFNALFTCIGMKLPRDLTQDIFLLIVISLIFYLTASVFLILLIAFELLLLRRLLLVGTVLLLLLYIMYVSQLIKGDRYYSIRWNDFILAVLMVYLNFILSFSSILYLLNDFFF